MTAPPTNARWLDLEDDDGRVVVFEVEPEFFDCVDDFADLYDLDIEDGHIIPALDQAPRAAGAEGRVELYVADRAEPYCMTCEFAWAADLGLAAVCSRPEIDYFSSDAMDDPGEGDVVEAIDVPDPVRLVERYWAWLSATASAWAAPEGVAATWEPVRAVLELDGERREVDLQRAGGGD